MTMVRPGISSAVSGVRVGDRVTYLGKRCNQCWGTVEASPFRVGQVFTVERIVKAIGTAGEAIPAYILVGVRSVKTDGPKGFSRSFAAENFEPVRADTSDGKEIPGGPQ